MNVRVSDVGLGAFDEVCKTRGVRRSVGFREAMSMWMRPPSGMGSRVAEVPVSALSGPEVEELRWWRDFAARTVLNGDTDRHVQAGVDLAGWTFHVVADRDENLEIA